MLEKTTCENFCQKRPPTGGGTAGQATHGTCRNNLPPLMKAAWMIDCNDTKIHSAVGPAAIVGGGMLA
jgi:hypothetical protein